MVEKRKKKTNKQGESKAKSWIESSSCTSKKKEMGLVKSEKTWLPKDEEKSADISEENLFQETHTQHPTAQLWSMWELGLWAG